MTSTIAPQYQQDLPPSASGLLGIEDGDTLQFSQKLLDHIAQSILAPDESNRTELCGIIREGLEALPEVVDSLDPYLGAPVSDYSWLSAYEALPEGPQDPDEILRKVVMVLSGQIRWQAPTALHNINQPVMLHAVAAGAIASLYNPNGLWDLVSAGAFDLEQQIVRQVARLASWDDGEAEGIFTFGGKGCIIYAIRIGLNRAIKNLSSKGIQAKRPIVITTRNNHYSIATSCSLIGIGSDNIEYIKTNRDERADVADFERILDEALATGTPVASVIVSGGNTLNNTIDPLEDMVRVIDRLVRKHGIGYRPFVHFDTPVGWPWLSFRGYDFAANPLGFTSEVLDSLRQTYLALSRTDLVDSISLDFHKDGFSPYSTSLFMCKNGAELHSIYEDAVNRRERENYGGNFKQHYMIEHSRSVAPILSAWVALQSVGISGFQAYLGHMIAVANVFRKELPDVGFALANPDSNSFCSLFVPQHRKLGDRSYRGLQRASSEQVERNNNYTYALFERINGLRGDAEQKAAIGFIPSYGTNAEGCPISTLRLYPMTPYLNPDKAREVVALLTQIKQDFDQSWDFDAGCVPGRPEHVPR